MTLPNEIDLAWAAGFIDGEGAVGLYKKNTSHCYFSFFVRISVANTNLPALERLKNMFGGSIQRTNHNGRNQKPCWTWYCQSALAAKTLEQLLPYLFVKREQAELCIFSRRYLRYNGRPRSRYRTKKQQELSDKIKLLKRA